MSEESGAPARKGGWLRAAVLGVLGLSGGAAGTFVTGMVDKIAKPALPVANFAVNAEGLTVTCQNHASGESGWWDFGDGAPLEPYQSDQATIAHAYAKPGSYSIKLIVRNIVSDENQRVVPVDVTAESAAVAQPHLSAISVQPVSPSSVAPATFKLSAEVQDADHCVWDFGDGRLEVADGKGKIERLVTFERDGDFHIQLVALNGKQASKQAAQVRVEETADGTLMANLKVVDSGMKLHHIDQAQTIAVTRDKNSPGFLKAVTPRPGYNLVEVSSIKANVPGVSGLKIEIAADKQSAVVSGKWADAKGGHATGSDLLIQLRVVEERLIHALPVVNSVMAVFLQSPTKTGFGFASLPVPPATMGMTDAKREMVLEIRQATKSGPPKLLATTPVVPQRAGRSLWSGTINLDGVDRRFQAVQEVGVIQVSYNSD